MKKKAKILFLTSEFPPLPGGIGNHTYNVAEYLNEDGYDINIIADQRGNIIDELEFDKQLKSRIYRVKKQRYRLFMYINRIRLFIRLKKHADIIICSGKFPLWIGALHNRPLKKNVIAIIHGTEVNFKRKYLKKSIEWALTKYDKIIAVSNYTKQLVDHLNLKTLKVIPNGFNPKDWENSISKDFNVIGYPKLLTVGNVTQRKGQMNVIKHLPELIKQYPNVHYHCIGLKTEYNKCIALAKQLKVEQHVSFHGFVSTEELKHYYQNVDILVMLSNETETGDVEGFGIALIEANYFGLPTIGSKGCGIEDAICHGKSGILIEPLNTLEFDNAIRKILDNKFKYIQESKLWAERHKWSSIIKNYINFIVS